MTISKTFAALSDPSFNPLAPPNPQTYQLWLACQEERTLEAMKQYKEIDAQIIREGLLSRKVILDNNWTVNDKGNYVRKS